MSRMSDDLFWRVLREHHIINLRPVLPTPVAMDDIIGETDRKWQP